MDFAKKRNFHGRMMGERDWSRFRPGERKVRERFFLQTTRTSSLYFGKFSSFERIGTLLPSIAWKRTIENERLLGFKDWSKVVERIEDPDFSQSRRFYGDLIATHHRRWCYITRRIWKLMRSSSFRRVTKALVSHSNFKSIDILIDKLQHQFFKMKRNVHTHV